MDELTERFLTFTKQKKQLSQNTLNSYSHDLEGFEQFVASKKITDLTKVSGENIAEYISLLRDSGKSEASIRRALVSVRCFYNYLLADGRADVNPAKSFSIKKTESNTSPDILTAREIELILNQPDVLTLKGCRDRAILEVLYATGMKATEIISLNVSDASLATATIHCGGDSCGSLSRVIPLYPEAVRCLEAYIKRAEEALILSDALFVNLNGQRLTRQGFWKIVKQYAGQAGIEKEISPDTIRRSFATMLLQNGADIKMVQEILGHSSLASTQMYLKLAKNKFSDIYARCHPRAS